MGNNAEDMGRSFRFSKLVKMGVWKEKLVMALHAQKKGKRGEVEFCKWLLDNFGIDTERNYNQSDGSSSDIIIDDFIFEIKRQQVLSLDSFWHQVVVAKKNHKNKELIPIVAYRQNRQPWRFLIPANLIHGLERGYLIASENVFKQFMRGII